MSLFGQYWVFLGILPLPVSPEKIEITVPNLNKTVTMVDQGEINILRGKGLKEIKFDMLVPSYKYPFANYSFGSISTSQIISYLENLKANGKPTQFIVSRCRNNKLAWWTNIKVSVEDFTVTEDANNGTDVIISINLKEYKEYSTKLATVTKQSDGTVVAKFNNKRSVASTIAPSLVGSLMSNGVVGTLKNVTVTAGKTLYNTMKTKLGSTDMNAFNKLKSVNGNIKNVIDTTKEIKLDV